MKRSTMFLLFTLGRKRPHDHSAAYLREEKRRKGEELARVVMIPNLMPRLGLQGYKKEHLRHTIKTYIEHVEVSFWLMPSKFISGWN